MSVFQNIDKTNYLFSTSHFFAIFDKFPVSPGHILIISKSLKMDYFDLDNDELNDLHSAIKLAKDFIDNKYQVSGYNVGMNCGKDAGQTVFHFHCHIIPRYSGDMENPSGGIRHCIQGKGYY